MKRLCGAVLLLGLCGCGGATARPAEWEPGAKAFAYHPDADMVILKPSTADKWEKWEKGFMRDWVDIGTPMTVLAPGPELSRVRIDDGALKGEIVRIPTENLRPEKPQAP